MIVRKKQCRILGNVFLFFNLTSISFAVVSISIGFVAYVLNSNPLRPHNANAFVSNIGDFPFFCLVISYLHYSIIYGFSLGNRLRFVFPVSVKRRLWALLIVSLIWMSMLKYISRNFQILYLIPPSLFWLSEIYVFIPLLFPWFFWGKQQYNIKTICRIWLFVQIVLSIAFLKIFCHKQQELNCKSIGEKIEEKASIHAPHQTTLSRPLSEYLPHAHVASKIPAEAISALKTQPTTDSTAQKRGETFSELNQLMDALLDLPAIPTDYGETMSALYRDKAQDEITRDFAVQHIGLYAQALNRSGAYDPDSDDARQCRTALLDAAGETRTIIAAAAFRALSDVSAFDPHIDGKRLDAMLVSCASDTEAAPAARVMAVQLCGERGVVSSRAMLEEVLSDAAAPAPLRRAAKWSLSRLSGDSP